MKVIFYHLFSRFCIFCASQYQVSVYRTIGPLVSHMLKAGFSHDAAHINVTVRSHRYK